VPVAHLDLYRVTTINSEEWGDLEPYFAGTIVFVEWPEHAGDWLPSVRVAVRLEHLDESRRRITVNSENDLRL
jgi:tRNA A37 threonylcarbamoyladenosine biosynthesis protein TsaE